MAAMASPFAPALPPPSAQQQPPPSLELATTVTQLLPPPPLGGFDASAADPGTLTLYLVLHHDDAVTSQQVGFVSYRHVTPWKTGVIGLRQDPQEARQRYFQVFNEKNQQANLVLFKLVFSSAGIARLTTEKTNAEHDFLPKLHKVKYARQDKDWGVWHFVGDLSLTSPETMTWSWSRMEETP